MTGSYNINRKSIVVRSSLPRGIGTIFVLVSLTLFESVFPPLSVAKGVRQRLCIFFFRFLPPILIMYSSMVSRAIPSAIIIHDAIIICIYVWPPNHNVILYSRCVHSASVINGGLRKYRAR